MRRFSCVTRSISRRRVTTLRLLRGGFLRRDSWSGASMMRVIWLSSRAFSASISARRSSCCMRFLRLARHTLGIILGFFVKPRFARCEVMPSTCRPAQTRPRHTRVTARPPRVRAPRHHPPHGPCERTRPHGATRDAPRARTFLRWISYVSRLCRSCRMFRPRSAGGSLYMAARRDRLALKQHGYPLDTCSSLQNSNI